MTLRDVRAEAERRPLGISNRIEVLAETLRRAASSQTRGRCAVCNRATQLAAEFVIPITYIATCLVLNDLEMTYQGLPLRYAPLCNAHLDHFSALFVYAGDPHWDVERLERRAQALGGVLRGRLLAFGGAKSLTIVEEFNASVVALKGVVWD